MGLAKRMLEERLERGYPDDEDTHVCGRCVQDAYLRDKLNGARRKQKCTFCGARMAANVDVLLECLMETIRYYYTDPAEELPYDSSEGGYQGEVLDNYELIQDQLEEWTDNESLIEYVVGALDDNGWCRRDYFGLSKYDALRYGWSEFARQVKHETRYLFFPDAADRYSEHTDGVLPQNMLEALGELFTEYKLFGTIEPDQELKRARVVKVGERLNTAGELGTAPQSLALSPNRMSPAGIPMFYAAFDRQTAVAETYEPRRGRRREIALATFRPARALRVLDLVTLPPIPSMFEPELRAQLDPIRFLHAFAADLSKPVKRDGMAHTEYVATQIVTEYVRYRMKDPGGAPLDGIVYRSSRNHRGRATVIFATSEQCGERSAGQYGRREQLLELLGVEHGPPPRRRSKAVNGAGAG